MPCRNRHQASSCRTFTNPSGMQRIWLWSGETRGQNPEELSSRHQKNLKRGAFELLCTVDQLPPSDISFRLGLKAISSLSQGRCSFSLAGTIAYAEVTCAVACPEPLIRPLLTANNQCSSQAPVSQHKSLNDPSSCLPLLLLSFLSSSCRRS